MRSYPRNSPTAAARVVALVLIADGHVSSSELESLNQLDGVRDLGLEPNAMPGIVQTLCEDLLMEGFDGRAMLFHLAESSLLSMVAEVDEPQLQLKVLRLAASVVHADKHLSEGEAAMLDAISRIWQTSPFTAGVVGAQINRRELAHAGSS